MRFRTRTKMPKISVSNVNGHCKSPETKDIKCGIRNGTIFKIYSSKFGQCKNTENDKCILEEISDFCFECDNNGFGQITQMRKSASLESITSGISSGSTASEERLNSLNYVSSYSSVSSKSKVKIIRSYSALDKSKTHSRKHTKKCTFAGFSVTPKPELVHRSKSHPHIYHEEDFLSKTFERFSDDSSRGTSNCSQEKDKISSKNVLHRQQGNNDVKYDPALEKSKTFLHGQGKTFSRTNQYLTPARPGLQKLQISYTQTNTENNHSKIFCDLVKNAHRQNMIVGETVKNLERRLLIRRSDPSKSTTFYEQKGIVDPIRVQKKKPRTVAEKQKERKERIKQTSDEIKMGYIPTEQTMKVVGPEEIEKLRSCTYLRVDRSFQEL